MGLHTARALVTGGAWSPCTPAAPVLRLRDSPAGPCGRRWRRTSRSSSCPKRPSERSGPGGCACELTSRARSSQSALPLDARSSAPLLSLQATCTAVPQRRALKLQVAPHDFVSQLHHHAHLRPPHATRHTRRMAIQTPQRASAHAFTSVAAVPTAGCKQSAPRLLPAWAHLSRQHGGLGRVEVLGGAVAHEVVRAQRVVQNQEQALRGSGVGCRQQGEG
jgi:hypothetical protein